jgi:hypothetical protein
MALFDKLYGDRRLFGRDDRRRELSLIAPLPAGAICSIAVRVTASVEGVRTGELTVVSTATNSPHIVLLSVGFLRILVGEEELAAPIDEQVVQLRPQAGTVGQSQVALDPIEHWR